MGLKRPRSEVEKAVLTLAGSVSNDFNNILMAIKGHASLVIKDLNPSHPHHRHLAEIMAIVKKGSELTEQFIGFAGEANLHIEPIDLNAIVMRSLKELSISGRRRIVIETCLSEEPLMAEVDAYQIFQILVNVLDNAVNAMPNGGTLSVITEESTFHNGAADELGMDSGRFARITVSDTGTGMDGKTLRYIFESSFSGRNPDSGDPGKGPNLSESQEIIKQHGGIIDVWSSLGEGTSLSLILPLMEVVTDAVHGDDQGMLMGFETILLVDDEEVLLEVGRDVLEDLGYTVVTAVSGEDALELYQAEEGGFDLVVLDLVMPRMDGYETFRLLQEIDPDVRVLIATGYPSRKSVKQMLDAGCRGVIVKPFDIVDFSCKLREALDE